MPTTEMPEFCRAKAAVKFAPEKQPMSRRVVVNELSMYLLNASTTSSLLIDLFGENSESVDSIFFIQGGLATSSLGKNMPISS